MSADPLEWQHEIVQLCARTGVALVLVPEVQGARASGAARWLNPRKAIIQLSLRYHWEDHFWFSFFHEASHILRHPEERGIRQRRQPP